MLSTLELRREDLLDRFTRSRPKIVAIMAPAGYGKSTFARQLANVVGGAAVCDCNGVRTDLDLARRVTAALGGYQQELQLSDGGASVAERLNISLGVWRESGSETFVFENAEHAVANLSAREFLGRLLGARPEERSVMLCTREGLRFHPTRYADPHEIMVVRARDLAFGAGDVRAIFGSVSDAFVERVLSVSQGWPIAVLLLHRFAAEGRIESLLDRLDDIAFEQLHDYLADEVLSTIDPRVVEGLFAIAAIPAATAVDLHLVTGDSNVVTDVTNLSRESSFVTRGADGAFHVHPLLQSLLLEGQEEKRTALLQSVASSYEGQRHFIRAAQLYLAVGDQRRAAQALARHDPFDEHALPMAYASVLTELDRSYVVRYPRLWGMTAMLRSFYVDFAMLLDEAESVWRTLPPDTSNAQRGYVFLCRTLFMGHLGRYEEAIAMLNEFARDFGVSDLPLTPFESYVYYVRAVLLARSGRHAAAERDLTCALPLIDTVDLGACASFLLLGADVARPRGERAVERQFLERALDRARPAGLPNFVANVLAECTVSAWFDGDPELFARRSAELEQCVEGFGVRAFAVLAAAARGRVISEGNADIDRFVAFGRLMSIARAADDLQALELARSALTAAEKSQQPFLEALAAIAVALNDENAFDEMMARARAIGARCEAPQLQASIDAIAERRMDEGVLAVFARQVSRARQERVAPAEISVAGGVVLVDGVAIALATRELELTVALAMRREPTSRARLATMLWPDVEESAARNALSVCLHRLRTHLGRDDIVLRENDGYRLNPDVKVDLWDVERAIAGARSRERLTETDRENLRRAWEALRAERPARMAHWEWFAPVERRFGEFRMEIGHRLGGDALVHGCSTDALAYAGEMIAYDPCDEAARELAIRALFAVGDRAGALRQYRQYRDTLLAELGVEPSESLRAMVGV